MELAALSTRVTLYKVFEVSTHYENCVHSISRI